MSNATTVASPKVALFQYWGRVDEESNSPTNRTLSMNQDVVVTGVGGGVRRTSRSESAKVQHRRRMMKAG